VWQYSTRPTDSIWTMMIVWMIKEKIVRSIECSIVCCNCAQCYAHRHEQFLQVHIGLDSFFVVIWCYKCRFRHLLGGNPPNLGNFPNFRWSYDATSPQHLWGNTKIATYAVAIFQLLGGFAQRPLAMGSAPGPCWGIAPDPQHISPQCLLFPPKPTVSGWKPV